MFYARELAWLRICEAHFKRLALYGAAGQCFTKRKDVQARWAHEAVRF